MSVVIAKEAPYFYQLASSVDEVRLVSVMGRYLKHGIMLNDSRIIICLRKSEVSVKRISVCKEEEEE